MDVNKLLSVLFQIFLKEYMMQKKNDSQQDTAQSEKFLFEIQH